MVTSNTGKMMDKKDKTRRDDGYMAFVRKHRCCVSSCGRKPTVAHHYGCTGKGVGQKCTDYETVPLCFEHHEMVHSIGSATFCEKFGVNFATIGERLVHIWMVARNNEAYNGEGRPKRRKQMKRIRLSQMWNKT